MPDNLQAPGWRAYAVFVGRILFAGVFLMGAGFKFAGMGNTATYIAAAGFPFSYALAWVAAIFEIGLVICLLSGAYFTEACLVAAIYVLFLGVVFHGPARWTANPGDFGYFVDHFTFIAGLLFAAAHGPGPLVVLKNRFLQKPAP